MLFPFIFGSQPDEGGACRHITDHNRVGSDLGIIMNRDVAKTFCPRSNHHPISQRRVPFGMLFTRPPQRYTVIQLTVISQGAQINDLVKMDVREKIGRYKYTEEQNLTSEYEAVSNALAAEIANVLGKGDQ